MKYWLYKPEDYRRRKIILKESAAEREVAGPKAKRPKAWRANRRKRRRATKSSRRRNR